MMSDMMDGMTSDSDSGSVEARARLLSRRRELENLAASTVEDRSAVELDQQRLGRLSRMDAIQVQAMATAAQQRRQVELGRIDAALRRLDAGEYGYCLVCGEAIATARLDFDPAVTTCVDCARGH